MYRPRCTSANNNNTAEKLIIIFYCVVNMSPIVVSAGVVRPAIQPCSGRYLLCRSRSLWAGGGGRRQT